MRRFKITIEVAVRDPQAVINRAKTIHSTEWNEYLNEIDSDDELATAVHDVVWFYGTSEQAGLDFLSSESEEGNDCPEDWPRKQLEILRAWRAS